MSFAVKEIFYTLQGEGAQVGRPAVFLRFAGCNLWSGREGDRERAICQFCDTDFVGAGPDGGRFPAAAALAAAVAQAWTGGAGAHSAPVDATTGPQGGALATPARSGGSGRFVVCTGGEPL